MVKTKIKKRFYHKKKIFRIKRKKNKQSQVVTAAVAVKAPRSRKMLRIKIKGRRKKILKENQILNRRTTMKKVMTVVRVLDCFR